MDKVKKTVIALLIGLLFFINLPIYAANSVTKSNTITNKNTIVNNTNNKIEIKLKDIQIEGKTLEPGFSKDIHQYNVSFEGEETELKIEAKPDETDANVTVIGNENLVDGQNLITIIVTDEKETGTATYQIYVNKNVVSESSLKNIFDTSEIKNIIKIGIVVVIGIIALIIIVCFIKFIKRRRNKKKDEEVVKINIQDISEELERQKRIQTITEKIHEQYERETQYNEKQNKRNKKNGKHSK